MEKIGHQRALMPHTEPRQKHVNPSAFDQEGEIKSPMQRAANSSAQVSQLRTIQAATNAATRQLQKQSAVSAPAVLRKENKTGLPDELKSGIENLSGMAMDDVKVHYNSSEPAQMQAHAFAQGTDIHVAPGQEQHLAHEAWHVVQQKQGRVQATTQLKGVGINDDSGLETEADVMGAKAMQMMQAKSVSANSSQESSQKSAVQLKSAFTRQLRAPMQLRMRQPQTSALLNSTTVDVWLSPVLSRKGHLFSKALGIKGDKATLIAAITQAVGVEGALANTYTWVTTSANYDRGEALPLQVDPYRLRLHGTYGGGGGTAYSVDVHFGPYHHGYIVHVTDAGSDGEIDDRARDFSGGAPLADFSSTHHNRADHNLMADTNNAGNTARIKEEKLDASTKLIGEGARFQAVAKHQANLTDSTKFFIRNNENNTSVRWITFDKLWLTWSMNFGKAFNITDEQVKARLVANDFRKISEPQAIPATMGVPGNITVGRDYSLDEEAAADIHQTRLWHEVVFNLLPGVGSVSASNRTQAIDALKAIPGVRFAKASASAKTYTVRAYDTVDEATMRAALPGWSRPVVLPDAPAEEEAAKQDEAQPEAQVVAPPRGVVESDFNKELNRCLAANRLSNATSGAKAALRATARAGKAVGITYDSGTKRYILGDGREWSTTLDALLAVTKVEVQEVVEAKKPAAKPHKPRPELARAQKAIEEHGGKRSERGYVLPIMAILAILVIITGIYAMTDKKG